MIYEGKNVRAAGILPFKLEGSRLYILLRNCKNEGYADFGGKVTEDDQTPLDIALREAGEESNGRLSREMLLSGLLPVSHYITQSKYMLFFSKIGHIDQSEFGDRELFMDIPHKVQWFPADGPMPTMHVRMSQIKSFVAMVKKQLRGLAQ